jgi:hypothetical protein
VYATKTRTLYNLKYETSIARAADPAATILDARSFVQQLVVVATKLQLPVPLIHQQQY